MSSTEETAIIEPVSNVPAKVDVCHFDELDQTAARYLPKLVPDEAETIREITDQDVIDAFESCDCDIVKFTRFYRIDIC